MKHLKPLFLLTFCLVLFRLHGHAQNPPSTPLTPSETAAVKEVIELMKSMLGPHAGMSWRDFTTLSPPENYYFIHTFGESCDELMGLLNGGGIVKAPIGGAGHTNAPGIDGDVITISQSRVADLSNPNRVIRIAAKIHLALNLINETTHLMQHGNTNDLDTCHRERDSDRASILLACQFLMALENDQGMPHTTLADIDADPAASDRLVACMAPPAGGAAWSAAELAMLHAHTKCLKEGYQRRKEQYFDFFLNPPPASWRRYYQDGGLWKTKPNANAVLARVTTELQSDDGAALASYTVPSGEMILLSMAERASGGSTFLATATWTTAGDFKIHVWTDTTGDGLPESGIVSTTTIPGPFTDPGFQGFGLYPTRLASLGTDGLIVHDRIGGRLWSLPLTPSGVPNGAVTLVASSPSIAVGAFEWPFEMHEPQPNTVRFAFTSVLPGNLDRAAPVVWFDHDYGMGSTTPHTVAGSTWADLHAPSLVPRLLELPSIGYLGFVGNPGAMAVLSPANAPAPLPLLQLPLLAGGLSPLAPTPLAFMGPQTWAVTVGTQTTRFFKPTSGRAIDTVEAQIDGNGVPDRLDLSVAPPRLHLSLGNGPVANRTYNLAWEQVLENGAPGFLAANWTSNGGRIETLEGHIDFVRLTGSAPPLFVQSVVDFSGDAFADESCLIRRNGINPSFTCEIIRQVGTAPFPAQNFILPAGFVPSSYRIDDLDLDGDLDICVDSFLSGPGIRFLNGGTGNFTMNVLPLYPGTMEDLDLIVTVGGEAPVCAGIVEAPANELMVCTVTSPFSTFVGDPFLLAGQFFVPGAPPIGLPAFGLQLDLGGNPAPFLLFDGTLPTPLGPLGLLPPSGTSLPFLIPPTLGGQSLMLQALTLSGGAGNGFFATSSGVEVRFE